MASVDEQLRPPDATRRGYRFSYRQLLAMDRAGIFGDQRVELIDGEILAMSPPNPPHAIATTALTDALTRALGERALVSVQNPLRLSPNLDDRNLPLPDIVVIARRAYRDHPQPGDVLLLIEIADASLAHDRGRKLELYAEHSVAEYWIVNLVDRRIEVHSDPEGRGYRTRTVHDLTAAFAPVGFPDLERRWVPDELLEVLGEAL